MVNRGQKLFFSLIPRNSPASRGSRHIDTVSLRAETLRTSPAWFLCDVPTVWALFSCCTDVWSLGWVQVNVFVPVSQFIKILKVIRVCLPYMNHFDFLLGWDVERTGGQGWTASRACLYGSKFLNLFLVLVIKNLPANAGVIKRHRFDPWVRKTPWRRKWQPTPVFLPGKSHGQRSLVGYSPQGHKELDVTEAM